MPAGVPAPGATAVTVAVRVTGCPKTEGLALEARTVPVGGRLTTWLTAAEVEVAWLAVPP